MSNTRTRRSAINRETETRRKPWRPPAMLETPEPPEGYRYRWIRAEMMGEQDRINVSKRSREGYELVRPEELDGSFELPTMDDGRHAGVIAVGGLLLAKIPIETAEERKRYYADQTKAQMQAIDAELGKESHPTMPIGAPQRQTHVSFGNPENNPSAKDSDEES